MQSVLSSSFAGKAVVAKPAAAAKSSAKAMPVMASAADNQQSRRAAILSVFGAGAALVASSAEALEVPYQRSLAKGGNGYEASAKGYTLAGGIKKKGISPKGKAKVLANVPRK